MLQSIISFSVRNKLIVALFTLALIVWGAIEVSRLPVDALPDITSNQVQVITVSPSLAAPEVERLITFPIEQANANIPGITEIRSISRFGLSVVSVVFEDDVDLYWARQQVGERITAVRELIPVSAGRPELAPATTGLGEIYQYVIRPEKGYEGKYDLTELRTIQDWIVRRQLLGTPGVADVSSFGGYLKQYEVAVVPDRLKSMNVSISELFAALENNNQNSGGAYIEKGPSVLFIRTEGLAASLDDIEKIFIKHTASGIPVHVGDVAEVRIGNAVRYGAMTYGNQGEVAGAVVLMLKGANASDVIKEIKKRLVQIEASLPEGVRIESFLDRTKMVDRAISTVKKNLLEGALIVVFILVLFLGNFRAGLIVASVIPLSMLFAVIMMNMFGVSGNLMSLGALDFGLIVDGAVIIVEAVVHRLAFSKLYENRQMISRPHMDEEVIQSSGKMMRSAVFGQIIILIVYLPILTLTGIEGKMFRPMAQAVAFALIGAFLLSLTYVPMMSALVLSRKLKHKQNFSDRLMNRIHSGFEPILRKALAFPKMVVGLAIAVFISALLIFSTLGGEFIPELEEGDFAVDARLMTGSSLGSTVEASLKAATILQEFPEVEKIVTRIGASEIPTDPMPLEMTDIIISLKPKDEWTSAKSYDELADKMSHSLQEIPGLTAGFQYPVQMRFNELISGARQDVVCKIFGEDLDTLSRYAHKLQALVREVEGATDVYVESITGLPQIVVNYNRAAIARHMVNIEDVNRVIRTAFAGESAGLIYENERRFDLVVRLKGVLRSGITDVEKLLISTPDGLQIPLDQLAEIRIKDGPNQIQREDARRRVVVGFNVRGKDVQSVVEELQRKVNSELVFPPGYYVQYGGQFENLKQASDRLMIAVPAALLLIFMMLYFAFGSVRYGILIFTAIPLSAIGGILALWIRDMPFSISAGVGFIALFGVSVLNGIVLIAEFNRLKHHSAKSIKEIVMEGTKTRLRPVLMTASVASLGFLPMALSHGAGAEVQRPLASVVIGGLLTATLLTLLVLPVLYSWIESIRLKPKKAVPVIVLFLFAGNSLQAQDSVQIPMKIEEVIRLVENNNLQLKNTAAGIDYFKQLQASVFDPPKTELGIEYGKINSFNNDTRVYLNQSLGLPQVYKRKKQLYASQENAAVELNNLRKRELVREAKRTFFLMVNMLERQKLLNRMDSIYSQFLFAADLKFRTGESNLLEKTSAELQIGRLRLQQQEISDDLGIAQQYLKLLMNSDTSVIPAYNSPVRALPAIADTSIAGQHPALLYRERLVDQAEAETDLERNSLSPDFHLGYSNQSIVGYQSVNANTEKYFPSSQRFSMYQLGIGLPLFNGAARSRIKAARVQEEIARREVEITGLALKNELQRLRYEVLKSKREVDYYSGAGANQSTLIINNASQLVRNGDMGYVEWVMLMQNALGIQIGALDAAAAYNETTIELECLTGNE